MFISHTLYKGAVYSFIYIQMEQIYFVIPPGIGTSVASWTPKLSVSVDGELILIISITVSVQLKAYLL